MKKLIKTSWNVHSLEEDKLARALLQYRNRPCKDGLSPAQKLLGQPIQDTLPANRRAFSSEWQRSIKEAEISSEKHQQEVEQYSGFQLHSNFRAVTELRRPVRKLRGRTSTVALIQTYIGRGGNLNSELRDVCRTCKEESLLG